MSVAFMVSLSNHEGVVRLVVRRFTVRQAHREAILTLPVPCCAWAAPV